MTSDQMVSVSPIWQLGHVEKGPDVRSYSVFAEPPYYVAVSAGTAHTRFASFETSLLSSWQPALIERTNGKTSEG